MFKKRLLAYIIDIIILFIIMFFIDFIIPNNSNVVNLNNQIISINDNFINGEIDLNTFINQYSSVSYSIDREMFLYSLVSIFISIGYFVIYPLYNGGQSLGKKLFNLKVVSNDDNDVSTNSLTLRYLLMHGIGVSIISMCLIFILNDLSYMYAVSILSILQFLVAISSVFMVLYRNDKRSLPDLIAGTKVIEVKK